MRLSETIYLDYQASTPIDPAVLAVMERSWRENFANPHSAEHVLGWRAAGEIEKAAASIAEVFGLSGDHVIFTSGATEANWLALRGCALGPIGRERRFERMIISASEHKSVMSAASAAARDIGVPLSVLNIDAAGRVEPQDLRDALKGTPALVSIIAVGNEAGAINDIAALRQACGEGVILHVDASQAPAAVDVQSLLPHADLITVSSHKVYGPKGVGALIAAPELQAMMQSLMPGGSQQGGLRPGTVPTTLCIAFAAAMDRMAHCQSEREEIASLRDRFIRDLDDRLGGVRLVGDHANRHPGNACVRIDGVEAADLLSALQPRIAASTQSACTSGTMEPSQVLLAMGLSFDAAQECIRFSLGRFSDESQVDEAVDLIATTAQGRRSLRPS